MSTTIFFLIQFAILAYALVGGVFDGGADDDRISVEVEASGGDGGNGGTRDVVRIIACGDLANADEEEWRWPGCRARDHDWHAGDSEPHPRKQNRADVFRNSDRAAVRHADAGPKSQDIG